MLKCQRQDSTDGRAAAFRLCAQVAHNFSKPANGLRVWTCKILFAQVDPFNFGADLIIFVKQLNEILLYLTEL